MTLTITFTPVTGVTTYNVKYRKVGDTTWINVSGSGSPIVITGVDNADYEGTVSTVCSGSLSSAEVAWTADEYPCISFDIEGGIGGGTYEYYNCGTGDPITGNVAVSTTVTVCTDGSTPTGSNVTITPTGSNCFP